MLNIMLIIGLVEFIVAIVSSVICCRAVCCIPQSTQEVLILQYYIHICNSVGSSVLLAICHKTIQVGPFPGSNVNLFRWFSRNKVCELNSLKQENPCHTVLVVRVPI